MLYVPGFAFEVVVPPPLPGAVATFVPQPTAPIAATESSTASSVPSLRLRGTIINTRQASVAPDPAAYHGVLPSDEWLNGAAIFLRLPLVVVTLAVRTNEVVAELAELITTGLTEKEYPNSSPESELAERLTEPVKPSVGVTVRTTGEAAAPLATLVVAVQGVNEKSGDVVETTSIGETMPVLFEFASSDPFDPANVESPEYTTLTLC